MKLAPWMLMALLAAPQQQTAPPRDAAGPLQAPATAIVRGRITAAVNDRPLHRVRVTLDGGIPNAPSAVTDTRGEFEISDVPAGAYRLTATRAGYLTIQYGQRRPREAGRTIEVEAGAVIEGLVMALPRGAVLAGRITDELGEPAPAVTVEALEYRYIRGRRVLVPARITRTNDAGDYRLSGLEPGTFQLRARSREIWESDDGETTHVYAMTYFPGVPVVERPQTVDVKVGQEVGGLDFPLLPAHAARITGIVEDATGQPLADQQVHLSELTRTIGGRILSSGQGASPVTTDARGAFEFSRMPSGEYIVSSGGPDDRASATIILEEGAVEHVVLSPKAQARVSGIVTTDDGQPPPFLASRIRLLAVSADPRKVLPGWGEGSGDTVRADWSFNLVNLEGPYLFRLMNLPDGWMVSTVRAGGRDITDTPLSISHGSVVSGLEIVMSRKGGRISGAVVTAASAPAPDATVVAFAEQPAHWIPGSRFVRATRPDNEGRFSLAGLPAGAYRLIARDLVMDGQWDDPEFLRSLLQESVRVDLAASGMETVRLTMGEGR
ncbi:MAG: carboxypeptidase-like regulatory domain-containing protein [Vicinamibacterales bacterium]